MQILDIFMIAAFVLFVIFMIRGVILQAQEKERAREMIREKEKILIKRVKYERVVTRDRS